LTFDLNSSLTQSQQVGTDTDGSSRNQRDGEDVVVRPRCGSGDQTRSLQTLDTKAVLETNNVGNLMTPLSILFDLVGLDDTS
jgi:hypothetical protein